MTRVVAVGFVCFLAASSAAWVWAQGDPAASAPWLGGEKYTVHTAGTLREVVAELSRLTGRRIVLSGRQTAPGVWEQDPGDAPVTLDFDNAPLEQILLTLCEQAGKVYELPGAAAAMGGFIMLRTGDPRLDARPSVDVGDYVIRVSAVSITTRRTASFRWGEATPGPPETFEGTQVGIQVTPKHAEASWHLAGLSPGLRAVPDQGEPLEQPARGPAGYYLPFWAVPSGPAWLSLPAPPEGATRFNRLEGALVLFSNVKATELVIPPNSEGQTFEQDDVRVKVEAWKWQEGTLAVNLTAQCPPLPKTTPSPGPDNWHTAVLVTKDGSRQVAPLQTFASGEGSVQLSFRFSLPPPPAAGGGAAGPVPGPPGEVDHLRLTLVRTGSADKTVPFVIENVPLP